MKLIKQKKKRPIIKLTDRLSLLTWFCQKVGENSRQQEEQLELTSAAAVALAVSVV